MALLLAGSPKLNDEGGPASPTATVTETIGFARPRGTPLQKSKLTPQLHGRHVDEKMSVSSKALLVSVGLACCSSTFGSTPWSVSASLDYYDPHGTPDIGDVGSTQSRHINRMSPVVAVNYAIKDWLSLELNYRYTPDFTTRKLVSGLGDIFGKSMLPALQEYELEQTINTVSIGPNCSLRLGHGFRLSAGVFAAVENVSSKVALIGWIGELETPLTEHRFHFLTSHKNSIRPSARVRLEYSVTSSTSLLASWTFIDSASTSASYLGLGVAHHF